MYECTLFVIKVFENPQAFSFFFLHLIPACRPKTLGYFGYLNIFLDIFYHLMEGLWCYNIKFDYPLN